MLDYEGNSTTSFPSPHIICVSHLLRYRLCCSSKRLSLEIMTQTSSRSLTWAHQALFNTYTCLECTEKEWQPPSSLLSHSLFAFSSPLLSSPLLSSPSIHPSLPLSLPPFPSKPMLCKGGRLTQQFLPRVYECAQERAHRQDYSRWRRQRRTITD